MVEAVAVTACLRAICRGFGLRPPVPDGDGADDPGAFRVDDEIVPAFLLGPEANLEEAELILGLRLGDS